MKNHNQILKNLTFLKIYIDDNEIENKIKTSTYVSQLNAKFKKYLKNLKHFIVYFEKLRNIDMTCQLKLNNETNIDIFVNNQIAIQTTINSKTQFEQYMLRSICDKIIKFKIMSFKITFH